MSQEKFGKLIQTINELKKKIATFKNSDSKGNVKQAAFHPENKSFGSCRFSPGLKRNIIKVPGCGPKVRSVCIAMIDCEKEGRMTQRMVSCSEENCRESSLKECMDENIEIKAFEEKSFQQPIESFQQSSQAIEI